MKTKFLGAVRASAIVSVGFLVLCSGASNFINVASAAELSTGILAPSRAVDWSQAGVVGGIPTRTTICSTLSTGATAAQINAAIAACPTGEVVYLNAGTYNLSTGIVMKSGVTLRGDGPDQTSLVFTGANGCGGDWADVCFADDLNIWHGSAAVAPGGSNSATWSGGYAQGATQITLTGVGSAGLSVGQYIYLDQANATSDNGGLYVCDQDSGTPPCSLEAGAPGRTINGVDRNEIQIVKITGISGSAYTITPGLYANNWSAANAPGAWWSDMIQNAGLENLSLDHSNSNDTSGVAFLNAFNNWMLNVRSINSDRNGAWFNQAAHNTVENNYFYGTQNSAEQSYGVESFISSDNLVTNNIFQHTTVPIMMGPSMGSVFSYNFSIDDYFYSAPWMMQSVYGSHDAGVMYNLDEGNIGSGFIGDVFHGTGGLNTLFRNRYTGWETGKTEDTVPIQLYASNRYDNVIGNVLGTSGYALNYQTENGVGVTNTTAPIYDLGSGNSEAPIVVPNDPLVAATLMRWGNYDTVNNSTQWNASEVPSTIAQYANPVPSTETLPASLYLSAKPSWWPAGTPWPAIGPDVSGGNIASVAGHAYITPAEACYNAMGGPADGTGNVLTFNAANCYGSSGITTPPPASSPTSTPPITTPTPDTTPPSLPANLSASAVSSSEINLSWKASTDNVAVTGYKIFRAGTQIGTSATTSYSDTGLSANTTYSYTVSAYDAAGNNSGLSISASATTQAGTVVPPTPTSTTPTSTPTAPSTPQVLSVTLSASAVTGIEPLSDSLTAAVAGTAQGTINYYFYCNRTDTGTNVTSPADYSVSATGDLTYLTPSVCSYQTPGTYMAKVIAQRGTAAAQTQLPIIVTGVPPVSTSTPVTPPTPTPPLSITSVTVGQVATSSAVLTVVTNQVASIAVEYGLTTNYTWITQSTPLLTTTYINLVGLQPNTAYDFVVDATGQAGGTPIPSQNYVFTTQAATAPVTPTPPVATSTPAPTPTSTVVVFTRTLAYGSTGHDVLLLQTVLKNLGYFAKSFKPTTYFGSQTGHAMLLFQNAHALNRSGYLDVQSQALMNKIVAANPSLLGTNSAAVAINTTLPSITNSLGMGSSGAEVTALQNILQAVIGYTGPVTGYYGQLTQTAVQAFQARYGIVSTGTPATTGFGAVGQKTMSILNQIWASFR